MPITKQALITAFSKAIATMEGFYKKNSLAQKNNNPGNLRSWGTTPVVGGYARFKTEEDGWAALRQQIEKNLYTRKLTVLEFFEGKKGVYSGYAPAADSNQPSHYADFVARFLRVQLIAPEMPNITVHSVLADLVPE